MTHITRSSSQPGSIARSDLLATFEDWLNTLGVHIGEIPGMHVDLTESDSAFTLQADIPGVNKDDIKIQVDGRRVFIGVEKKQTVEEKEGEKIIYRERSQESIHRSFTLDQEIDEDNAQARYENGVLELILPKKSATTIRRIEIK